MSNGNRKRGVSTEDGRGKLSDANQPSRFIVAEISKNWRKYISPDPRVLSEMFEEVIVGNLSRGYILYDFQLNRIMTDADSMNETIIAVFERIPELVKEGE